MINELVQGKTYYIPFISPYTSKGPYSVEVSAITRKSSLDIYGDFDIRGTFFNEVGIKTYITMVTDDTDIYICHIIKSFDPVEIDTGDFIFIPKSIVDFGKIEEYKNTTRFTFTIEGVRRRFETSYELKQFIKKLEKEIPDALGKESILANDLLSISDSQEELLVRNGILKLEEESRDSFIKAAQEKITAAKKAESDREMDYYKRVEALNKLEKEIAEKKKIIDKNLLKSQIAKDVSNKWLSSTNELFEKIKIMYDIILPYATQNDVSILSWKELLNKAYSGIDLNEWKELCEVFMKNGETPDEWVNAATSSCPFCNTSVDILFERNEE